MPQRIAIVTGAARGIGAGTAKRLAADGFAVAVLDLNEADGAETVAEIEKAGGKAIAVGADVSNAEQVAAAVDRVVAELGEPTVLINNAGVTRDNLIFKMSENDWDTVMNVHLRGAFLMTRAAQKYMVAAKWGRIVNLSSTSAVGNRGQVNYSAAKAGMQGFTKTLAIELGKYGVTANAIAPGFIVTDMTAATAARLGVSFEDFQAGAAKGIPVQRVGKPEDIAQAVSFFVSDAAGFVSGQVLYVAGGPVSYTRTGGTALSDNVLTDLTAREADLRATIRAFCADHDPTSTPRDQFLSARFDAGLAAVHYPVGHGGLGLPRSLQQAAEDQFARAGAPAPDPRRNVIGLGMAAPTIIAFGTDEQQTAGSSRSGWPRTSGASSSASPGPAATWPACPPARSATATTGWSTARRCGPRSRTTPAGRCCWPAPTPTRPSTPG